MAGGQYSCLFAGMCFALTACICSRHKLGSVINSKQYVKPTSAPDNEQRTAADGNRIKAKPWILSALLTWRIESRSSI